MNPLIRFFSALICFVVAFQSVWLWDQTGRATTTYFMDPDRSADALVTAEPDPIQQVLISSGVDSSDVKSQQRMNRFQFGLMPSGMDQNLMSVATFGGPSGLIGLWLLIGNGKPKGDKKKKK